MFAIRIIPSEFDHLIILLPNSERGQVRISPLGARIARKLCHAQNLRQRERG
jgi:hypothetical protein